MYFYPRKGSKNPRAKLKEEQVLEMRALYAKNSNKWTQEKLGEKFGVKQRNVCKILRRESWKHI